MALITIYVKQKHTSTAQRVGEMLHRARMAPVSSLTPRLAITGGARPFPARSILLSLVATTLITGCPDQRLAAARRLAAQGQPQKAAEAFVALAKADPANLGAWDGAVQIWCRDLANVGKCMSVLDLELKLLGSLQRHRDALSEVLERRARARLAQGLVDAALADLDRATKAGPNRASVHAARARAHMMRGAREDMLRALKRAKTLDPHLAEVDALYRLLPSEARHDGFGGSAIDGVSPTSD